VITFAEFEADERSGELRRHGVRVRLQDLPFRVLIALVRRTGDVVSREELRGELWGAETFVDAEAGLNTAVAKLREALGDDAEAPRFVETVPKRGYRFIGVLSGPSEAKPAAPPAAASHPGSVVAVRRWALPLALLAALLIAAGAYSWQRAAGRVTIAVVRFHNETGRPDHDRLATTLTDAVVVSLADNPRYGVIGNSPLLRTERIFEDVKKIGEALEAQYVVLGQLQNGDNGLLARAHFIRVSDQTHLWAGKIELGSDDAPERLVTSAVARGVAAGLEKK
jgi:DNA-binding winged helix-turn-helix (wHTH) protein/TolB-like protein